jgi:ankyrin repeat protein
MDLEASDQDFGMTPLELACHLGRQEVVSILLSARVGANSISVSSPLYLAAEKGNSKIVEMLIRHGADVSFIHEDGWSALFEAAGNGHLEVTKILVESGLEPNLEDGQNRKAIDYAAQNGYTDVVKYLAQYASDSERDKALQETLQGRGVKARKKRERQKLQSNI